MSSLHGGVPMVFSPWGRSCANKYPWAAHGHSLFHEQPVGDPWALGCHQQLYRTGGRPFNRVHVSCGALLQLQAVAHRRCFTTHLFADCWVLGVQIPSPRRQLEIEHIMGSRKTQATPQSCQCHSAFVPRYHTNLTETAGGPIQCLESNYTTFATNATRHAQLLQFHGAYFSRRESVHSLRTFSTGVLLTNTEWQRQCSVTAVSHPNIPIWSG